MLDSVNIINTVAIIISVYLTYKIIYFDENMDRLIYSVLGLMVVIVSIANIITVINSAILINSDITLKIIVSTVAYIFGYFIYLKYDQIIFGKKISVKEKDIRKYNRAVIIIEAILVLCIVMRWAV